MIFDFDSSDNRNITLNIKIGRLESRYVDFYYRVGKGVLPIIRESRRKARVSDETFFPADSFIFDIWKEDSRRSLQAVYRSSRR